MRKKPKGKRDTVMSAGGKSEFATSPFPEEKQEREAFVVVCAIAGAKARVAGDGQSADPLAAEILHLFANATAEPNTENDFDFTLVTGATRQPLELTEFAPLDLFGHYDRIPNYFLNGAMADVLLKAIMKKARHYGTRATRTIHLLTYATDYRLVPDDMMAELLTVLTHRYERSHPFASITVVFPQIPPQASKIEVLYPKEPSSIAMMDESALRKIAVRRFDLGEAELQDDGSIVLSVGRVEPSGRFGSQAPWSGQLPVRRVGKRRKR